MLALRYLLINCGVGMMIAAVCILTYDLYREMIYRRLAGERVCKAAGGMVRYHADDSLASYKT